MKTYYEAIRLALAGVIAWVSGRLGILAPLLIVLLVLMVMDYLTGMGASKYEALRDPDDPSKGWSSRRGAEGILKKAGYMCVVTTAFALDYLIVTIGDALGFGVKIKAAFALLVTAWYILNELLSIVENAGRMGAPVPVWLSRYIAVLKSKIDDTAGGNDEDEGQ